MKFYDYDTGTRCDSDPLANRINGVRLRAGWCRPWWLTVSQPSVICLTTNADLCPTAMTDYRGRMVFNRDFVGKLTDPGLTLIWAHELSHVALGHGERRQWRDPMLWNIAADMAINAALERSGFGHLDGGMYPPDQSLATVPAEEIYDWLIDNSPEIKMSGPIGRDVPDGTESTEGEGEGESEGGGENKNSGGDGDKPPPVKAKPGDKEIPGVTPRRWREARETANATAGRGAGADPFDFDKVPPSRIKWKDVVRSAAVRALTLTGKDDLSFKRRSHRSQMTGPIILPGPISYQASLTIAIDSSGSVDDASLSQAASECESISTALGVAIYLIVHDDGIRYEGWIGRGSNKATAKDVASKIVGRGGTTFSQTYDRAGEIGNSVFVHLTDGCPCDTWPPQPRKARQSICALIGVRHKDAVPAYMKTIEVIPPGQG